MRDSHGCILPSSNNKITPPQNLFLFEANWKLAVAAQIQTSRRTNWELTLSQVCSELGQDLISPQSLIEEAYVCHELLSSNIWGFSQPSNSWGLISWDFPWSVQASGLPEPPSEDWEDVRSFHWVVIAMKNMPSVLLASTIYPNVLNRVSGGNVLADLLYF